ncbi:hypothetical protein IFT84_17350 [Rhizobium sp. CFBP 8762]|uniref:hypothetical protein n=1 Tax=Rhizobium sp. CFBP 8762 TaxID=2775279 RepID=UPI00177AB874|nr:hypothetical protein [Rhizobium sp. CFBP 8762]MBD8556277.1 hypothetical protein [Rhizobium sp. CFBP 8762]
MKTFFLALWPVLEPLVALFVTIVGPVLVTWISAQLIAFLKINSEARKAELEKTVSEALHRSIANGLKAAVTKFKADSVSTVIINAAADYVVANNPDAIKRFDISPGTLNEMILSKVPDVLATINKANTP